QFVYSRFYLRKIETLDDPDTSLKQSVMGLDPICEETADREIINADGLHLLYCKVACRFLRDVDEILHKVIGVPTPGRIPRLEEDSLTALNLVWSQLHQERLPVNRMNYSPGRKRSPTRPSRRSRTTFGSLP